MSLCPSGAHHSAGRHHCWYTVTLARFEGEGSEHWGEALAPSNEGQCAPLPSDAVRAEDCNAPSLRLPLRVAPSTLTATGIQSRRMQDRSYSGVSSPWEGICKVGLN